MKITNRTITGGLFILLGAGLVVVAFLHILVSLVYGLPILVIGFFILLNKKEDEIEQINERR